MMKRRLLGIIIAATMLLFPAALLAATIASNPADTTLATVAEADTLEENYGTVTNNRGTVTDNRGTVTDNRGTVTDNRGTVTDNYGTVNSNSQLVEHNYNGGTVENRATGSVTYNYGTVYNYGGGVYHNYGTVKNYHRIELKVQGGPNDTASDIQLHSAFYYLGAYWVLANADGEAAITVSSSSPDYMITDLSTEDGGGNVQSEESEGVYTLTEITDVITIKVTLKEKPVYEVSISPDGYTFEPQFEGYSAITAQSFTLKNTGNQDLINLTASLSGTDAGIFFIVTPPADSLDAPGGTTTQTTLTVKPKTGLAPGTHTANIDIDSESDAVGNSYTYSKSVTLNFTVTAKTYTATLSPDGKAFTAQTAGYAPVTAQTFTVQSTGNQPLTGVTATLSGTDAGSFEIVNNPAVSLDAAGGTITQTTFTVKPKDGLTARQYNATVNINATVDSVSTALASKAVSFTVNPVPTVSITGSPTDFKVIKGSSITLTANISGGTNHTNAFTYLWSNGATTQSITVTPTVSTAYSVVVTDNDTAVPQSSAKISATNTQNVTVVANSYSLASSLVGGHSFGTVNVGYATPDATTFTITNTGNTALTLNQPTSLYYNIGKLSTTAAYTLAPQGTATFSIAPKAKMKAGIYNETIIISAKNLTDVKTGVMMFFVVKSTGTTTNNAPVITTPTKDQTVAVNPGSMVTLSVNATNAASYQWFVYTTYGWRSITNADNYYLTISPVTAEYHGSRYCCVISNSYDSTTSPIFTISLSASNVGLPTTGGDNTALWLGGGLLLLSAACLVLARRRSFDQNS